MIFHLERPRIDMRSLLDSVVSRSDGLTGGNVWTPLIIGARLYHQAGRRLPVHGLG